MGPNYRGHRFPAEIISHAVWLYHRFTLSFRDVEDLLAARGIIVSYEAIRFWCLKFGPGYARSIREKRSRLGDIWHVDELFLKINGQQVYLWRAVDQDGDVFGSPRYEATQQASRSPVLSQGVEGDREDPRGNSSRTSSRAIQLPIVRSFPQSSIERVNMKTTELKSLINIPENKRGRCESSNQPGRLSDSLLSTVKFRICFGLAGIISKLFIIVCFATVLLQTGERRPAPAEQNTTGAYSVSELLNRP